MKRHTLLFITGLSAIAIVAACFCYFVNDGSRRGLTTRVGEPRSGSATAASMAKGASDNITKDEHPSQTEAVNPEAYKTNPPQESWEKEMISWVNKLGVTDTEKAERLLNQISSLPPEGQVMAMDYATKLIPDEDYLRLRPQIFQLVKSEELREVVLLDALTRGETLRMPTLVEMLKQPQNPAQSEVREILVAYLEKDYGNDTAGWDSAVKQFLAENPDL